MLNFLNSGLFRARIKVDPWLRVLSDARLWFIFLSKVCVGYVSEERKFSVRALMLLGVLIVEVEWEWFRCVSLVLREWREAVLVTIGGTVCDDSRMWVCVQRGKESSLFPLMCAFMWWHVSVRANKMVG